MKQRICIVDGIRTPMCKSGDKLKHTSADELGVYCVKYLLNKLSIKPSEIDEVIFGNVCLPPEAPNIARVISLKAGIPNSVPAFTVQRNCASGMESIISGIEKIELGLRDIVIAGGTESMSNIPFLYRKKTTDKFVALNNSKTFSDRLKSIASFRISDFSPIVGLLLGLTDPVTGNLMGKTAEFLAREFKISRKEQDEYAYTCHQKALASQQKGIFNDEIVPIPIKPDYKEFLTDDIGISSTITIDKLARKRPFFDRLNGTVTVGNSCQITDGAAAVVLMTEEMAKKKKLNILGYVTNYSQVGLEPDRMGLGPIYAISKLLEKNKKKISDYDLFEINEAFAVQVIANLRAAESTEFAKKFLNREKAVGTIEIDKLNVNGGAIALGHPVGMTGTRIIIHLLKELKRRNLKSGIASLCVGGGQGVAVELESV